MSGNAIPAQGTQLFIGDSITSSPIVWTQIKELKSYRGLDGQSQEIDVSDLDSTAHEFLMGLRDEGGFTATVNRLPSDPGQAACLSARGSNTLKPFKLVLPSGSPHVAQFNAYVKQFPIAGGVNQAQAADISLRISGAVSWT